MLLISVHQRATLSAFYAHGQPCGVSVQASVSSQALLLALTQTTAHEGGVKWSSAISQNPQTKEATDEVIAQVRADVSQPSLVLLFASPHHAPPAVLEMVREAFPSAIIAGCPGAGIIGKGRELEHQAAISLVCAHLPEVTLRAVHVSDPVSEGAWSEALGVSQDDKPNFVILADPFTMDVEGLLTGLDHDFPEAPKVGGLASGARRGPHPLWTERVHAGGAVVLTLSGSIAMETIIAQGCKPIGQPTLITRCEGNMLHELGSQVPTDFIHALYESSDPDEQALMKRALFLGIEMQDQLEYQQGDFLVRNILGQDPESHALVIGAKLDMYKAVQLHVRDKTTSAEDLDRALTRFAQARAPTPESGALMFSCLGRGQHLYGEPDHDAHAFAQRLPQVPMGGFFCNGEIGQVGERTFLHGYTSAIGVFRPT